MLSPEEQLSRYQILVSFQGTFRWYSIRNTARDNKENIFNISLRYVQDISNIFQGEYLEIIELSLRAHQ